MYIWMNSGLMHTIHMRKNGNQLTEKIKGEFPAAKDNALYYHMLAAERMGLSMTHNLFFKLSLQTG